MQTHPEKYKYIGATLMGGVVCNWLGIDPKNALAATLSIVAENPRQPASACVFEIVFEDDDVWQVVDRFFEAGATKTGEDLLQTACEILGINADGVTALQFQFLESGPVTVRVARLVSVFDAAHLVEKVFGLCDFTERQPEAQEA